MIPRSNCISGLRALLIASAIIIGGGAATARAQSLCDDFHVPAAHIGNVRGCQFDGAGATTITFNAPAILRWDRGFRIGPNQTLRFDFPDGQNGTVLNRDLSGRFSNIAGTVSSNGRVLLINPAADISIQPGALIDADGGFLASTLNVQDDELLLFGDAEAEFQGDAFTAIDNRGTIRSANGDVILIGGSVNNFASGKILAPNGSVHIGAATQLRLAPGGDSRITVIEGNPVHSILNFGSIEAGVSVGLSAFAAEAANPDQRNSAIINHGIIRTTTPAGRVFLSALPGSGRILNAPDGQIETQLFAVEGELTNEGAILEPDLDFENPTAPTASRQFPRLASGTLSNTPTSDFRLSLLSFSHLNGLESEGVKKSKKKTARPKAESKKPIAVRGTQKKPATAQARKIVLRRGSFFGKKTK